MKSIDNTWLVLTVAMTLIVNNLISSIVFNQIWVLSIFLGNGVILLVLVLLLIHFVFLSKNFVELSLFYRSSIGIMRWLHLDDELVQV